MPSIILMGAGASRGSGSVAPEIPPLGNGPEGLFARLEAAGGLAASLPNELKNLFRNNFEEGMAQFYEHSVGDVMRFQREMAGYLAQFAPGDGNAYINLIRTVGPRRAIFASLNYDLLFELSAEILGLDTSYGIEPTEKAVRLLKLHGSANFWPDIRGIFRRCTFDNKVKAAIVAPVLWLDQAETLRRFRNEDSFAPAIAIYAEGKAVKVCPEYVARQQILWRTAIARSNKIFVVGVKVNPADDHIWGELARSKANVSYFGLESDEQSFVNWKTATGKTNAYFIEATFEECIEIIACRLGRI